MTKNIILLVSLLVCMSYNASAQMCTQCANPSPVYQRSSPVVIYQTPPIYTSGVSSPWGGPPNAPYSGTTYSTWPSNQVWVPGHSVVYPTHTEWVPSHWETRY